MIKGGVKWEAKNRTRLALSTEKPPEVYSTRVVAMYGIAQRRLVMPVCPQGNMEPISAITTVNKRITPVFHVSRRTQDP